ASYAETSRVAWTGPYWLWAGVEHDLTALLIHENLIATALILLWLVPQSAWLRRPSRPPTGTPATPRPSRRLRAWSVYTTASLGSLAYLAATLLLRAVTHADIPAEVLQQPDFAIAFTYWLVALAILAQVAVAFTVAATIGRSGVASALYAAFLTGIAASMIPLGGIILRPCVEGFG